MSQYLANDILVTFIFYNRKCSSVGPFIFKRAILVCKLISRIPGMAYIWMKFCIKIRFGFLCLSVYVVFLVKTNKINVACLFAQVFNNLNTCALRLNHSGD